MSAQPASSDEIIELANLVQYALRELEEKIEEIDDDNYLEHRAVCLALVKGIVAIPDQIIPLAKPDETEALLEHEAAHPKAAELLQIAGELEAAFADMVDHIEELQSLGIQKHAAPLLSVLMRGIINSPDRLVYLATGERRNYEDDDEASTVALASEGKKAPALESNQALIDKLSIAYRSNRKLCHILSYVHDVAVDTPNQGPNSVDVGWMHEAATDIHDEGYCALLGAAELLGAEEGDLARFTQVEDQS